MNCVPWGENSAFCDKAIFCLWAYLTACFMFVELCCRVNSEGSDLLHWELVLLGVDLVESQFPGGDVGIPTSARLQFKRANFLLSKSDDAGFI